MAPARKAAAAVVRSGEGSPTPAEVYQAALLAGRTGDEARELSEQRAIELANGAEGEAHVEQAEISPAYVFALIEAWASGGPLDFGGAEVPADVQRRIVEVLGRVPGAEQMIEQAEPEAWDPEHCPTPKTCFPYLTTDAAAATCIHGTSTRATRES
jgi:hypothetical protein